MEYRVIRVRAGSSLEDKLNEVAAAVWKLHSFQMSTTWRR